LVYSASAAAVTAVTDAAGVVTAADAAAGKTIKIP